jgi:hypothetical protein
LSSSTQSNITTFLGTPVEILETNGLEIQMGKACRYVGTSVMQRNDTLVHNPARVRIFLLRQHI